MNTKKIIAALLCGILDRESQHLFTTSQKLIRNLSHESYIIYNV